MSFQKGWARRLFYSAISPNIDGKVARASACKGHFEPEKFEDQYEDALKELLKKKQAGEKIEAPKERAPAKVINLMDALLRSVETEPEGSQSGS